MQCNAPAPVHLLRHVTLGARQLSPHTQPSVGLQVAEAQEQLLYFFYTKKDARLV